jgi:cystathionine beta-lyase/cystathionine gamma-synthase
VSTFKQGGGGETTGYDYSRSGNPTRDVLEAYIADLEGAESGFAFASGMSAISASIMLLKQGDHLLATEGLYGGTHRVLTRVFRDYGITHTFVDTSNLEILSASFQEKTRAVLLETPSNPMMRISDLEAVAVIAKEHDALLMVDNTFMTPVLQRPHALGADVVIHSATKFLGGHSDLIQGLVTTSDPVIAARIKQLQNALGAVPSPFDSWLMIRGMKTLGIRLAESQTSAGQLARWLSECQLVDQVNYPDLDAFPGSAIHRKQADGPGAILSFRLNHSVDVEKFLSHLEIWSVAVSLGAVESIITRPARMTHLSYSTRERSSAGIDDSLLRLSVGIEAVTDLISDLEDALNHASRTTGRAL